MTGSADAIAQGTRGVVVLESLLPLLTEPHPSDVRRRVVRTGCGLVDAGYGALTVRDVDGATVEVVDSMNDSPFSAALRALLSEPRSPLPNERPTRCRDLRSSLTALGMAEDARLATSYLSVPIRSRRGFEGTLAVLGKQTDVEFSEGDEQLLVAFAGVAGAVIDDAQLSYEAQQRELWVSLEGDIARSLLAGVAFDDVLDLVVRGARELTDTDFSTVCLLDDRMSFVVRAADGDRAEVLLGREVPLEGTVGGDVLRTREPRAVAGPASGSSVEPFTSVVGPGTWTFVPLAGIGQTIGALAVARREGRPALGTSETALLRAFASQVSVVLECGRSRAELERLRLLDDEERIARDLHDTVIQQLFATGMSLQAIAKRMTDPGLAQRVLQAVATLDGTIRDIRSTVFALAAPADGRTGVRAAVMGEAVRLSELHDFSVYVDFRGPVDTALGPGIEPHLLATLREALSNVARHARASTVDVALEVGSDIVLRVADDGVGIPREQIRRSGLRNLSERAAALGGAMRVFSPRTGGTVLEWRIPIGARWSARAGGVDTSGVRGCRPVADPAVGREPPVVEAFPPPAVDDGAEGAGDGWMTSGGSPT